MPFPIEQFPHADFHSLDVRYWLNQFEQMTNDWRSLYTDLITWKNGTIADLETWKNAQTAQLREWENHIETNIESFENRLTADQRLWYAEKTAELNLWKTNFETLFNETFSNLEEIKTAAEDARDEAIDAADSISASLTQITSNTNRITILENNGMKHVDNTVVNTYNTIFDAGFGVYFSVSGTKLKELGDYNTNPNLPSTAIIPPVISTSGTYMVICYKYTQGRILYDVFRVNGSEEIIGIYGSSGNLTWYDISYKTLSNGIANSIKYTTAPTATAGALKTAEQNTYFDTTGANLKIMNPELSDILNNGTTYQVTIYKYGSSSYRYITIESPGGLVIVCGRLSSATDGEIVWEYKYYCSGTEKNIINNIEKDITDVLNNNIGTQIYTEFTFEPGWYGFNGELINDNLIHTDLKSVIPDTYYYLADKWTRGSSYAEGAFFDKDKNFISALAPADLTEYSYREPNADPDVTGLHYVKMYRFKTPVNCYYFSYNASNSDNRYYRTYFANKPIYRHSNTGNIMIPKTDPIYSRWNKRKLAVIGPSTVMIDRLLREGNFENNGEEQAQYVVGFQEYLAEYWGVVDSFGYSSAAWPTHAGEAQGDTGTRSMYFRIVTQEQLDSVLGDYDDYLLLCSHNGFYNDRIGTLTAYNDLGDNTTYIGAIRQVIEHIYTLNPQANIYVQDFRKYGSVYTNTRENEWNLIENTLLPELYKLSEYLAIPLIKTWSESQFNNITAPKWSYDNDGTSPSGAGHFNHIGSEILGMFFRKSIIGV